jgi:hypothetical protein
MIFNFKINDFDKKEGGTSWFQYTPRVATPLPHTETANAHAMIGTS